MRSHGHCRKRKATSEYNAWIGIKGRCHNKNCKDFKDYGARGIKVCARWRNSFESFYADMGSKPSPRHSLDRKNNDGNYTPKNCRWASPSEQRRNRRDVRFILFRGRRLLAVDLVSLVSLSFPSVKRRLKYGPAIPGVTLCPGDCARGQMVAA